MKLTPIRGRGKRTNRGQPKTDTKQSADATPPAKRAKKHHQKVKDATAAGGMLKKGMAWLSQLPQEILERVFISSKNLSLPRVSRDLYHRLTSDSIKYQLVGAAFGPTWDTWYGLDCVAVQSYDGWISDPGRIEGDPAFQSAVLARSWAKFSMLIDSFDVWIRRHARGRTYFTIPEVKGARLRFAPQSGSLYDQAYNSTDPIVPAEENRRNTMTMRSKLSFDLAMFQSRFSTWEHLPSLSPPGRLSVDDATYCQALLSSHLEVHPGVSIPDDVLEGPFESEDGDLQIGEEKMLRLFWLVRAGACLQRSQAWEVTRQGFREILQLLKRAEATKLDAKESTRRVQLAWRLFVLFGVLGVYESQWPKYIAQTSLLQVRTEISYPQMILYVIATKLQRIISGHQEAFHTGHRWRWRALDIRADTAADRPSGHVRLSPIVWSLLQKQYARFFLEAMDGTGQLPLAPHGAQDDGHAALVVHEPWSDFGSDFL